MGCEMGAETRLATALMELEKARKCNSMALSARIQVGYSQPIATPGPARTARCRAGALENMRNR